jgi:hypothetical protein
MLRALRGNADVTVGGLAPLLPAPAAVAPVPILYPLSDATLNETLDLHQATLVGGCGLREV